jgi:antitoxin VapB
MSITAKLFMHDGDQAVELPDEFRFAGEEVRISKIGDMVILEPLEMSPSVDIEAVPENLDSPGSRDVPPDDPSTEPAPRIVRNE